MEKEYYMHDPYPPPLGIYMYDTNMTLIITENMASLLEFLPFYHTYTVKYHVHMYSFGMLILLFLLLIIPPTQADPSFLCLPKNGSIWHGAFPPVYYHLNEMQISNESIESYIQSSGKSVAVVAFSHEWSVNRSFPTEQVQAIHAHRAIPYIRLMLRSDNRHYRPEPVFTLRQIYDGVYDRDLILFAREAKKLDYPILIEYGTEVNGWWFSWNGYWTGKEKGAILFRSVYRHIVTLMRTEGADNLFWVYHINWHSNPEENWNTPEAYYPGDEYIDIIGISAYGALSPTDQNVLPFSFMIDEGYSQAQNISSEKPVLISETGTDLHNPSAPAPLWITDAFSALIHENRWPRIIGFVWWNAAWPNDTNNKNNTTMRIEENQDVQAIFKEFLSSDTVLGNYCP